MVVHLIDVKSIYPERIEWMTKRSGKIALAIALVIVAFCVLYATLPTFSPGTITIAYPYNDAVFPPEIAPPTFRWEDTDSGAESWDITVTFEDGGEPLFSRTDEAKWSPPAEIWETIKKRSIERHATITIHGVKDSLAGRILTRFKPLSENSVVIATSAHSVGASIFYRDIPLPYNFASAKPELVQWRLGDLAERERPPVVMGDLPVCAGCHSFTRDSRVLGMNVDAAGDGGSYAMTPVRQRISITPDMLISWNDDRRGENAASFGLLPAISPDGRYVASAVQDRVVAFGRGDMAFSLTFFPVYGILAYYDRETHDIGPIPGADDARYVHGNPSWSPDGSYLVFARAAANDSLARDQSTNAVLYPYQAAIILGEDLDIENPADSTSCRFDLYRLPFNDGRGGTPEPIPGASRNGMSNYFARYSPDGKWIVFCQAARYMMLQPDSKLFIMPADFSAEPRPMRCNTNRMNSWHSWSPNGRWLIFSSKALSAYTDLFLTHIDENGQDSPPVLIESFSSGDRACNMPEFVTIMPGGLERIEERFIDYLSYNRRGEEQFRRGNDEEAEEALSKSIELNPKYVPSRRNLGSLMAKMNRPEDAEQEYEAALKLDSNDPVLHYYLGMLNLGRKEYDRARSSFESSLKLDPRYAEAYEGMGELLYSNEEYDAAIQQFETAIRLGSERANVHYFLGSIYLKREEMEKAQEELEYALKITPRDIRVLHNLGIVYISTGDLDRAENALRTVYTMNPNNPVVCFLLGGVLGVKRQTLPEAISLYTRGLSIMPTHVPGFLELGNLYLLAGNKNMAITMFEQVLKLNPSIPDLRAQINALKQQK